MSLNKVTLIGRLGQDPEMKRTGSGNSFVNMSVATSESWRDKNSGERKEKTEWHRVVIWNEPLAKIADQYLRKGSQVYLEGKMQTRKWEKDGQDHFSTEVILQGFDAKLVMLGGKNDSGGDRDDGGSRSSGSSRGPARGGGRNDMDDEIPFSPEWR